MLINYANALKMKYNIPSDKSYATNILSGYTHTGNNFLHRATLNSKLIVVSHSNDEYLLARKDGKVGGYLPIPFAKLLCDEMKLKNIGIISFKGCNLGHSDFLENMKNELCLKKVNVGWLSGYRSGCSPHGASAAVGLYDEFRLILSPIVTLNKYNDSRVKIVKGNKDILPPNGNSDKFFQYSDKW
ncbi:hypothetical protein ACGVWS_14090 [Enterobacteriaceae bacterium LUAb1]